MKLNLNKNPFGLWRVYFANLWYFGELGFVNDLSITIEGCLDSVVQIGEECDDGNLLDDDECANDCKFTKKQYYSSDFATSSDIVPVDITSSDQIPFTSSDTTPANTSSS